MFQSVIFDLDGTLIDSRAAILDSLDKALSTAGLTPHIPLAAVAIGPPLRETLHSLTGSDDPSLLTTLSESFAAHYDTAGYRESRVFPGIGEVLQALAGSGRRCFLATNKRIVPTRLILRHLQWEGHFADVYSLDRDVPRLPDKRTMLERLLADHALDTRHTILVGDTPEDTAAARANGLSFAAVTWGYGNFSGSSAHFAGTASELLTQLLR